MSNQDKKKPTHPPYETFKLGSMCTVHAHRADRWTVYRVPTKSDETIDELWANATEKNAVVVHKTELLVLLMVRFVYEADEWYVKLLHPEHGPVVVRCWLGNHEPGVWVELVS